MAKFDVVNLKNEKVGTVDLPEEVFASKVNQPLVLQVIKAQLAGVRQGTAMTKTKGLVRGGGKKPFRQKGTGNARQGSSRSPLNPGGGRNFGPQPRNYSQRTPKEMVRGALRSVLSDKATAQHLIIIDEFNLDSAKTKDLAKTMKTAFKVESVLFVDNTNKALSLASRNLKRGDYLKTEGINVYDVVRHDWLFLSKESAQALAARLV